MNGLTEELKEPSANSYAEDTSPKVANDSLDKSWNSIKNYLNSHKIPKYSKSLQCKSYKNWMSHENHVTGCLLKTASQNHRHALR